MKHKILERLADWACRKVLKLKFQRFIDWSEIVKSEMRTQEPVKLALSMAKAYLGMGRVGKRAWRRRMRVCAKCPVYDKARHKCRPWSGSPLGCGCYMPFKAMTRRDACWIRVVNPETRRGFDSRG